MERTRTLEEEAFWRKLTLPEEEEDCLWDGIGYRWFRSPNILAIEHYRRRRRRLPDDPTPKRDGSQAA